MIISTQNAVIANNSAGVRKFPHATAMRPQDGLSQGALSFLSCTSKWEADHLPHAFTAHAMNVGGGYAPESNRMSKGKWSIANPRSLYTMTSTAGLCSEVVLQEHSNAHPLTRCLRLFSCYKSRAEYL